MLLGPLDEKDATRGDSHFPITVFGKFRLAVGNLTDKHNVDFNSNDISESEANVIINLSIFTHLDLLI